MMGESILLSTLDSMMGKVFDLNSIELFQESLLKKFRYIALLPAIILLWPLIITLVVAFASASSWLFWLVMSVVFGILQLIYVIYQFIMVSIDLLALITLKTFAIVRAQFVYYISLSGLIKRKNKKRQKRDWKKRLYGVNSYSEYCQLSIEEPDDDNEDVGDGPGKEHTLPTSSANNLRGFFLNQYFRFRRFFFGEPLRADKHKYTKKEESYKYKKTKSCLDLVAIRNSSTILEAGVPTFIGRHSTSYAEIPDSASVHGETRLHSDSNVHTSSTTSLESFMKMCWSGNKHENDGIDANMIDENEVESLNRTVKKQLGVTGGMLLATANRLREARMQAGRDGDSSSLKFLLSGVVKRNHLSVDDLLLEDARLVDFKGQCKLSSESRRVINGFVDEVERCLYWIADSPTNVVKNRINNSSNINSNSLNCEQKEAKELSQRLKLLQNLNQNTGSTALMLSGGGAQAMYHAGTVRALIEAGLYSKIPVVSGTSGGSIVGAMCAMMTETEMLEKVLVTNVATDYGEDGRMKRENIRWFPPLMEMGTYWMKTGLLVDSKEFKRCCDFYYSDMTFEEAFQKTGKHVCITVSASRSGNGVGAQRLLLNHISTPHVTLSSAVAASCALPGVMAPAKLFTKNSEGKQELFEVDGVDWIDGSVQADLPFRRISTLFNVSEYIVCQCNFHITPFLNKAHHPSTNSFYWRIFQTCEWDIRSRALNLSRLGLFPKIFGQDVSKVFKQKYHGNLTLVPRFTKMQVFGLQALANPTVDDMKIYLKYGQIAAFPYIEVMKHMVRLENAIEECIKRVDKRLEGIASDDLSLGDGSVLSSVSFEFFKRHHRSHVLDNSLHVDKKIERKTKKLADENEELRKKVALLEKALGINLQEQQEDDEDNDLGANSEKFKPHLQCDEENIANSSRILHKSQSLRRRKRLDEKNFEGATIQTSTDTDTDSSKEKQQPNGSGAAELPTNISYFRV